MLPRWHIFLGALFTLLIWVLSPNINYIYLIIAFLSSFLIDFDHYLMSIIRTNNLSLSNSFKYHSEQRKTEEREKKKGIRKKGDFHLFHTIEFHLLIGIISIFFTPFFYIFIGMVFHSLTDLLYLLYEDRFYRREFFFFNWLGKQF